MLCPSLNKCYGAPALCWPCRCVFGIPPPLGKTVFKVTAHQHQRKGLRSVHRQKKMSQRAKTKLCVPMRASEKKKSKMSVGKMGIDVHSHLVLCEIAESARKNEKKNCPKPAPSTPNQPHVVPFLCEWDMRVFPLKACRAIAPYIPTLVPEREPGFFASFSWQWPGILWYCLCRSAFLDPPALYSSIGCSPWTRMAPSILMPGPKLRCGLQVTGSPRGSSRAPRAGWWPRRSNPRTTWRRPARSRCRAARRSVGEAMLRSVVVGFVIANLRQSPSDASR